MVAAELFEKMGGLEGIRSLVDTFYDVMDSDQKARKIRDLHPDDLTESREKLFMFLVGWSGGPPLYINRFGHPRLRARHLPFPIGAEERDQWMYCMERALRVSPYAPELRDFLYGKLEQIADFMRNDLQPAAGGVTISRGPKGAPSDRSK